MKNPKKRKLTVPEKHQLKIARDTLRMPDAMARVMGGPTKAEARRIIKELTGKISKINPKKHKTKYLKTGVTRTQEIKPIKDMFIIGGIIVGVAWLAGKLK